MSSRTASTSATASAAVGSSIISTFGSAAARDGYSGAGRRRDFAPAGEYPEWRSEPFKHLWHRRAFGLVEKGDAEDRFHRLTAHKQIARDIDRVTERQIPVDHLDMATA